MKRAVTSAQMRALEQRAADEHGIPSALLMENAGAALAQQAQRVSTPQSRFLVLCGRGNNGGDGLVAARKLVEAGREVRVEVLGDPETLQGEPRRQLEALRARGGRVAPIPADVPVFSGDVVIDALLGTGINRPPDALYAGAIERIVAFRTRGAKVVAADLPSGLHADTGFGFAPCVQADLTVAFGFAKTGLLLEPGAMLAGELRVVEIGLPPGVEPDGASLSLVEESDARGAIPKRRPDSHKGSYGHVLVVAGSPGKTGAGALAGISALRSGAGLVTVAARGEALAAIQAFAPELMGKALPGSGPLGPGDLGALLEAAAGKSAVVIGPGIERDDDTGELIGALLEQLEIPCVIDADGLNAIGADLSILRRARGPVVLTPHPGEAGRLLGRETAEIQRDRVSAARMLAAQRQAWVVLKGARTLIAAPDGELRVNPTGNPGMATGGTGDVLSGICGAFLAQGIPPLEAITSAVYAHGLAGDLASARTGQLGLIASDLLVGLTEVWRRWGR